MTTTSTRRKKTRNKNSNEFVQLSYAFETDTHCKLHRTRVGNIFDQIDKTIAQMRDVQFNEILFDRERL